MTSFVRSSKFRHIFGQATKSDLCFNGLKTEGTGDTNCAVSGQFLAMIKATKVFVIPLEKHGRQEENNLPYLDCKSKVLDVQWSPFSDYILATAEESGDINIWEIPEGGLKEPCSTPMVSLQDVHTRKVTSLQWHPSAEYILATAGADNFVTIWNCEEESPFLEIPVGEMPTCIAWNYNGSRLGITTKQGKSMSLILVNPHTGEVIKSGECAQGMKPAKLAFLKNGNIVTASANKQAQWTINIWDKDLNNIFELDLGSKTGTQNLYYDHDLFILYVWGKGESTVNYYEINEEANEIFFLSAYSSPISQKGGNFMPKRCSNTSTAEIARFFKLQPTKCEPISFIVPRKSDHFQKDLYPKCSSDEPALKSSEWVAGADKDPCTMEFEPGSSGNKKESKKVSRLVSRKGASKTAASSGGSSAAANGEALSVDLKELLEDMKKVKATVRKLNKRVTKLEEKLEQEQGDNEEEEEEEEEEE